MKFGAFSFLADENIHPAVIAFLLSMRIDVMSVYDLNLNGSPDEQILSAAFSQNRVVLTHDSDFGTLAIAAGLPVVGIVYLRPGHIRSEFTNATLKSLLQSTVDLTPPFILVAVQKQNTLRIRVRAL